MSSHTLGVFVDVDSSINGPEPPRPPQKVISKTYHSVPLPCSPEDLELNELEWGPNLNADRGQVVVVTPPATTTISNDVDMSRPPSPTNDVSDGVDALQSFSNPPKNRYRMISVSLMNFVGGLSDSAPGALIPYMEKHYNIGYALVSLIFVTTAAGFITAAFFVEFLRGGFGRAKTLAIANCLIACAYIIIVCTPPWPVVVMSFFLLGLGMAINLALGNVFAANLNNATKMLGLMHGSYGAGGIFGPLISTVMASNGILWSRYYLITLSVALFNLAFGAWSFWDYEEEQATSSFTSIDRAASHQNGAPNVQNNANPSAQLINMLRALKKKTVILGALFVFAYQGAEVSISGWVISFLISARNGNPASIGYVTAGFWSGITIGRFVLSPVAHKVGEKPFVYAMIIGSAVFELLVWQVPNVIGDAVALAIVGLLMGPIYPCAMVIFSRGIKRSEQIGSMGVISAFGSSGGAVAPFTTGILAQAVGAFVLHPIAIGLFGVLLICWFGLPHGRKRTE